MHYDVELQLRLANERIDERLRQRALERLAAAAAVDAPVGSRRTLRRSIGLSIIRIGERLAAESPLSSARSAQG